MERHKTTTAAFRSFDIKGKGRIKRSHMIEGLDRLRIRLAASDIETLWNVLDPKHKGYVNFNEFCILSDIKTSNGSDPFSMKAIETKV